MDCRAFISIASTMHLYRASDPSIPKAFTYLLLTVQTSGYESLSSLHPKPAPTLMAFMSATPSI